MSGVLPRVAVFVFASVLAFGVAIGWGQHLSQVPPSGVPAEGLSSQSPGSPETASLIHLETAGDLDQFDQADVVGGSADDSPADAAQLIDSGGFPSYPLPSGNPEPLGPAVFRGGDFRTPLPRSPVWNPAGPKRVGIQIGHWFQGQLPPELQRLSAGTSGGGWSEWEANLLIGQRVVEMLQEAGVEADLLPATIPIRYRAQAFVAIHADGDTSGALNGYKIARPGFSSIPDADDQLVRSLYQEYGVATGMPRGICTVAYSASTPFSAPADSGTPMTGSVVCAATTPARCAAPPAAAMMAFMPFFLAFVAHSATACGVRCADMAFAS